MKVSKQDVAKIRAQAKTIKQWYEALGISRNTLLSYCEKYNIPTDLNVDYILPIEDQREPTVDQVAANHSSSSLQQWDSSLIGGETKQPNSFTPIWQTGEKNLPDSASPFRTPGNPQFKTPNTGFGPRRHTI